MCSLQSGGFTVWDCNFPSLPPPTPGTPSQTGVGMLIINLQDINDNPPTFAEDYRPVLYENQPAGRTVVTISAIDRDQASNGAPFEFWLPCGGGCPCDDNPTCDLFGFKFVEGKRGQVACRYIVFACCLCRRRLFSMSLIVM